jgi:hypothetical protein
MKPVAQLLEFAAQLEMIVDLPVENNRGVAIIGNDRLVSTLKIDNFQARRTHGKNARAEYSALIRSAMSQRGGGAFDALGFGRPVFMCKAGYPTQIRAPFASRPNQPALPSRRSERLAPGNPEYIPLSQGNQRHPETYQHDTRPARGAHLFSQDIFRAKRPDHVA